jgi:band 4.1-like protein 4A
LGDYDPRRDTSGYVSEFEFIPRQTEELEYEAHLKHKDLRGLPPELCEINFLHKVKWLDMYGVDLQLVKDDSNVELFLGLTPNGLSLFRNKDKISNYLWTRIKKFECKGTKFVLYVIEDRVMNIFFLFNIELTLIEFFL